jgi:hypothetical protein
MRPNRSTHILPGRLGAAILGGLLALGLLSATATTADPSASPAPTIVSDGGTIDTSDGNDLAEQVDQANASALSQGMVVRTLTVDDFLSWYDDLRLLDFPKPDRQRWDAYLADGRLPPEVEFDAIDFAESDGIPDRIDVVYPMEQEGWTFGATVIQGDGLYLVDDMVAMACVPEADGYTPCVEEFRSPLPSMESVGWPSTVPVRVQEVPATGQPMAEPGHPDTLRVELGVTPSNRADIARYLAVGFDPADLDARLDAVLAADPEGTWVELQDLLGGWLAEKADTFPVEGDNEVCFGPARQFFASELRNGGYDRSTEAVMKVLRDGYCPVPEDVEPRFGDFLNVVGAHAGRFILKDPGSGRWIGFSVQSGGNAPYRFWWVDEDFSGAPFDRIADPDGVRERVDVWRRCRAG